MARQTTDEIRESLLRALEEEAGSHAIDIVDVEVAGAKGSPIVRIRIDHDEEGAEPITLDEVGAQTEWISALLDELDPFEDSYVLEVSSPGLARPLRRARDFERFAGEDVQLTLDVSEGRRRFTGELLGLVDGRVRLATDDGEHDFELQDIKKAKIKPRFDARETPRGKR